MKPLVTVIELDRIVKEVSSFKSFRGLINAKGGYRPTIRTDILGVRGEILAKAYNKAQAKRGDHRRAYTPERVLS